MLPNAFFLRKPSQNGTFAVSKNLKRTKTAAQRGFRVSISTYCNSNELAIVAPLSVRTWAALLRGWDKDYGCFFIQNSQGVL
jgi:hypothetical protein